MTLRRRYDYPCSSTSSCSPVTVKLQKGIYTIEAYGARGGTFIRNGRTHQGGKGGYAKIVYSVDKPTNVYLYIGGEGSYIITGAPGGWNGGGTGGHSGGSGGGATDVRLVSGNWDNRVSLESRIVVAGGGGGAYGGSSLYSPGGNGGGEKGEKLVYDSSVNRKNYDVPCIATQTGCTGGNSTATKGEFGKGAGCPPDADYAHGCGGGGYYGGGCGLRSASGGSGYVANKVGSELVTGQNDGNGYIIITSIPFVTCDRFGGTDVLITIFSPVTTFKI